MKNRLSRKIEELEINFFLFLPSRFWAPAPVCFPARRHPILLVYLSLGPTGLRLFFVSADSDSDSNTVTVSDHL